MADVFLSYKRQDRTRVDQLSQALIDLGLTVWFDYSIDIGEDWAKRITAELDAAKAVIVCWSPEACLSSWVLREAGVGAQRNIILPLVLRACEPPSAFVAYQTADLTDWDGSPTDERFLGLLSKLEQLTGHKGLAREGWQRAGGRAGELVALLRSLLVAKARTREPPFTYEEIEHDLRKAAKKLHIDMTKFAQPSLWGALDEIADQNRRNREPPLSVLVVNQDTLLPGRGYFQKHVFLAGKHDTLEKQVFKRHLARVRRHTWDRDP